jgi:TonB family protein
MLAFREAEPMNRIARQIVHIGALCVVGAALAIGVSAGDKSGRLTGTVRDQSGGALSNATVMAIDPSTNTREMTVSDEHGRFQLVDLPPGKYEVEVMRADFKNYDMPNTDIEPGKRQSIKITLDPGFTPMVHKGVTRLRIGGNVQQSKLLRDMAPVYPKSALRSEISGSVILHAVIGIDGTPLSLTVLDVRDNPELARAAVEAVQHWRYSPTLRNYDPVEVDTTIAVTFRMK